jgi:hypothetical protein
MRSRLSRPVWFVIAAVLLLIAGWSLLWVFSSGSLACQACNCTYSLFAENPRCRQPVIAELVLVAALLLAGVAAAFGIWRGK